MDRLIELCGRRCGEAQTASPKAGDGPAARLLWGERADNAAGLKACAPVLGGKVFGKEKVKFPGLVPFNFQLSTFNRRSAFTLLELLAVITIMGILAGLAVPALKNIGTSNAQVSAVRQLLDDIGRARALAISQRTTVYMVFVPTNFWGVLSGQNLYSAAATNLVPLQLTGYNFISYGRVGDQPGQHAWRYLSDWKSLPEGSFIPAQKFPPQSAPMQIPLWQSGYGSQIDNWGGVPQIYPFSTAGVPFPTESSPLANMPCLAFDYLGRLVSETPDNVSFHHAYVPLAQGSVGYGMDANKQPMPTTVFATSIKENPPGNSTSISYNVIDVNPQTGRATLQKFRMQ